MRWFCWWLWFRHKSLVISACCFYHLSKLSIVTIKRNPQDPAQQRQTQSLPCKEMQDWASLEQSSPHLGKTSISRSGYKHISQGNTTICTGEKGMAFEDEQAIKILLGEMFTEINPVFSTLGYYCNTYSKWHTINGALNQELLQEKHNPNFSVNLDKKTGFGKFQQHKWLCDIPYLLGTSHSHKWAPSPSRGGEKRRCQVSSIHHHWEIHKQPKLSRHNYHPWGTIPPTPLRWVFIYMCHFTTANSWDNGTHKKNS